MSETVAERFTTVRAAIDAACARSGRAAGSVTLVAASKAQPAEALRAAYAAGQRHFGENYAAEMREKQAALADLDDVVWHFIGRVQSSNARMIATATLVHGVGSWSQLEALAKVSAAKATTLQVLLQVNLEVEASKNGFDTEALRALLARLPALTALKVCGLMAMPVADDVGAAFAAVAALRDACVTSTPGLSWPFLSMGMSADFEAAIAAGATHVRVGSSLFGQRGTP